MRGSADFRSRAGKPVTTFRILEQRRIGNIDVKVVEDARQMGCLIGDLIAEQISKKADTVLGLCTGETPVPVYDHLVHLYAERRLSFSRVTTFNLDEYFPMRPGDSNSYSQFMNQHLFNFIDIQQQNVYMPSGLAPNPEESAARYEELIRRAGGIDLLLAGLGHNTHIGFNEPPCDPGSRTRLVHLSDETRAINARFFQKPDDVPRSSMTMGLGTILESRSIILCAFGKGKAQAVYSTLCGPVNQMAPGSFIQRHSNALGVFDRDAASMLHGAV
jgi:glucosamine-6-phosphate deaminase